jgi:gamma-glutamyltranspeptidase/glutathione hydrolase
LEPAIAFSRDGYEVSKTLAGAIAQAADCHDQPGFRDQFFLAGKPPLAGQTLRHPNIADALQLLVAGGVDAYYRGPIADALVRLSRQLGGWFEPRDLASHRTAVLDPIAYDYNGYRILEQPAPSQGVIVLQCLALARQLGIRDLSFDNPDRVHRMIEILKACYADRFRFWADPAFATLPIEAMLSDNYLSDRAKLIDPDHARQYDPGPLAAGRDTTYFAVADAEGNALSYIQSVFHSFGCGVVEPTYGIVLNNRMNGFTLEPGHPNVLAPGKRPVHTLNTYLVMKDDVPLIIGGTPGGPSQVQWNFQVLSDILDRRPQMVLVRRAPRQHRVRFRRVRVDRPEGQRPRLGRHAPPRCRWPRPINTHQLANRS